MKNRRFSILSSFLVLALALGCRNSSHDLADPDACNNPFTAIPCTTLEEAGQGLLGGPTSTPEGDVLSRDQTRKQME